MTAPSSTTHQSAPDRAARIPYRPRCFNKRSRQRFERDRVAELVRHLGRVPSFPERIIISRIVALEFELQKFDAKMIAGEELSGHLLRARLAAENRLRLDLRELGLRPAAPPAPTLADIVASATRQREQGEAA